MWCILLVYIVQVRQVIRTQIYLTGQQRDELLAIGKADGKGRSELIREAVDRYIETHRRKRRRAVLRDAAGIWKDRTDLPALRDVRETWNRG